MTFFAILRLRSARFARNLGLAVIMLAPGVLDPVQAGDRGSRIIRMMTQNLDQGTDFSEILAAQNPAAFVAAVTKTYQNMQATKPAERAAAIAREIIQFDPDVVALQEASLWRTGSGPTSMPAATIVVDQLELLLGELRRSRHPYEATVIIPGLDVQAPSTLGINIRITDRTVIIGRADSWRKDIRLSNIQAQDYFANLSLPSAVGPILNRRGWASVDVTIAGASFRFVTTHLEQAPAVQLAQAGEAIQSAINTTTLPVVFAGDFNVAADSPSDPTFPTYQTLTGAYLVDAWSQKHAYDPGVTCCQDANLLNPSSKLTHRVDLVFFRGGIGVRDIQIVGALPSSRTSSGLWPSDHAGIAAALTIPVSDATYDSQ
jgi:endonuclease/exonuclease/phosphatase family metal-dependent hydrolase